MIAFGYDQRRSKDAGKGGRGICHGRHQIFFQKPHIKRPILGLINQLNGGKFHTTEAQNFGFTLDGKHLCYVPVFALGCYTFNAQGQNKISRSFL